MAEKPNTTDTFTIAPAMMMSLTSGIVRNKWEVRKNGSTVRECQYKTINECKAFIRKQFPSGTKLSWVKRDEVTWLAKVGA